MKRLTISPGLLQKAMAVSGEADPRAVVIRALEEFIARRGQRKIRELLGKLEWDPTFDYKRERSRPKTRASG